VLELRRVDPNFEYESLEGFLRAGLRREAVRAYLAESGFFRIAYYLAAATHEAGHAARARQLWRVLADGGWERALVGDYAEMARRQLARPTAEPLLNPSARRLD
jgi:hypothetical protein